MFDLHAHYRRWRYKNTLLLLVSVCVLVLLIDSEPVRLVLHLVGTLGYVGAFLVGILFVSTFTVAPAMVLLFALAQGLDPVIVACVAGAGAVMGDFLIFRFFKDRVFAEVRPVFMRFGGSYLSRLFSTPYFAWLAPVAGALIIASPLPDEIGVGLLGSTRIRPWQFLALSFVLNSVGILAVTLAARAW